MNGQRPARVTLRHQDAARRTRLDMTGEIDAQTGLGEALVSSLMRAQLRLAGVVLLVLTATLGSLPLVFHLAPGVRHAHVLGAPLPWILLGGIAYPLLLALGWYYVVHAERNEAAFIDVLDQS